MPSKQSSPRILQVDADAFYVQVARLSDPDGAGKTELLLVGGSAEGRGVVTSAAYACRAFGVRSGMPTAQALKLCPDAVVVGVPGGACSEKSRLIVRVLQDFTPVVEPASIDEMYLDLTGTEELYKGETLEATARRIRQTVLNETEIAVSIGGGTTRLVAKLAANRAKPHRTPEANGVLIVPPGTEAEFLISRVSAHGFRNGCINWGSTPCEMLFPTMNQRCRTGWESGQGRGSTPEYAGWAARTWSRGLAPNRSAVMRRSRRTSRRTKC
jgi:hypothetical protein